MQQPVAATPLLGQLPLAKYSTEIYSLGCPILVKSLNFVPLIRVPIRIDILGRFLHFQSFRATFTIPQLTCKFCYILIIFAIREDLICHFSITYCLRYQGDRVLVRLSCIIYQSLMLVYILYEITKTVSFNYCKSIYFQTKTK